MAARRTPAPARARITPRIVVLTALGVAVVALYAVLVPLQAVASGTPLPLAFLLGAGLAAAPLLALTRPRSATAVFCAAASTLPLIVAPSRAVDAPWPWSVPAMILFILLVGVVTFCHGPKVGAFPLVIGAAGSVAAPLLRPDMVATAASAGSATADMIVAASLATAALLIAALVASRRRVSAELTREKEHSALEESRRALVEERTRIARELHDVIAHSMSVIQVQASTARYRLPQIGEAAAAEFDDIAATARTSLTEMRRMLGVLRTEDRTAELAPQQGIDDVPALVDSIRRAGVDVGLLTEGAAAASAGATSVQIAAFRIVQEALSNAVRHAPGSRIDVRLRADASAIRITVRNSAPTLAEETQRPGFGLRGMRERAELLGGSLTAGPEADGGWVVEAVLPLNQEEPHLPPTPEGAAPEGAR